MRSIAIEILQVLRRHLAIQRHQGPRSPAARSPQDLDLPLGDVDAQVLLGLDPADFDDAVCNRFHSGQQVTNVVRNAVEGGRGMTCSASNQGDRPWGPAGEQRFPVIDAERGLVFGVTLLHYLRTPTPSQMYVSEVFKVERGRITHIDNIGLVKPGLEHTTGFGTHK